MLRYYIQAQWRGCHAPRERVSWNAPGATSVPLRTRSRSTWACELKCERSEQGRLPFRRHAPRERVSWNVGFLQFFIGLFVTLHVSVWVEILSIINDYSWMSVTLHVSVWVEIAPNGFAAVRRWSRSTWACELKYTRHYTRWQVPASRSTWACELKSKNHGEK